jgi:hypothetical protein
MTSFADLAAVKVEDIPEQLPLPMGTYVWEIIQQVEQKETRSGNGFMVNHRCRVVAPAEDFENPEELEEYQEKSGSVAGQVRTIGVFYPTEPASSPDAPPLEQSQANALRRLVGFYKNKLGLDGDTIGELQAAVPGAQFYGMVTHEADRDNPEVMRDRLEINNVTPLS